jgi:Raf kinase inhibitor-like YbhB/YbcL family protein
MELVSDAFASGESILQDYTCDGANLSPPLTWRQVPSEVEAFVLICDDPDAPRGPFSHWVLYDIPADVRQLEEGVPNESQLNWGGVQGRNSSGDVGYTGPCPPQGAPHHYYFRLYALDEKLGLSAGAARQQVLDRMEGHILDNTELLGLYARS